MEGGKNGIFWVFCACAGPEKDSSASDHKLGNHWSNYTTILFEGGSWSPPLSMCRRTMTARLDTWMDPEKNRTRSCLGIWSPSKTDTKVSVESPTRSRTKADALFFKWETKQHCFKYHCLLHVHQNQIDLHHCLHPVLCRIPRPFQWLSLGSTASHRMWCRCMEQPSSHFIGHR